jgi:hypothetical protein
MDEATRDLLAAISQALEGMADWRAVAVRSGIESMLSGKTDTGDVADWLRDFLAQRREVTPGT